MESWPAPAVPRLPGRGLPLRVHDTSTRALATTTPGATATLYVCGITPYDATHLGHAATYVAFDTLQRVWGDAGHGVAYVSNVTDVDDPLLERAERDGVDWTALAERETALFREDMAALRVLPPRAYVGAVEAIPTIVGLVERLRAAGVTYDLEGDVYLSAEDVPGFGSVSGLDPDAMRRLDAERGGDPDRPHKRHPSDSVLWRLQRPGEPGWDSPFGRGRPGWHVECAAIALTHLGDTIDVNGGGTDLAYPHHEHGSAVAEAATGARPFARAHVHAGMVGLDGEKMSKSRGNLVFVSALRRDGVEPAALRLALLSQHYRADWEWTPAHLQAAEARLDRWRAAVTVPAGPPAEAVLAEVRAALAADLDAPSALAAVDRWVAAGRVEGGAGVSPEGPRTVRALVDALLGVAL
jgi:L-cysteine:1D-myo-inositol 2-amino-2-deoxy-alpha-D-glucopyranoside ligase